MKPLLLPPTIRTCLPDEVSNDPKVLARIADRNSANIIEGYSFKFNKTKELPFIFFAEINIDNDKLWGLLKTFILQFPEEIACIYHHIDDEPTYSIYEDKFKILNILSKYQIEITQDGFLEIGVIFHNEEYFEEVFIKKGKYIRYWGMDVKQFENTMNEFDLHHIQNLNFIDEYPLTTESLGKFNCDVVRTEDFLSELDKAFKEE